MNSDLAAPATLPAHTDATDAQSWHPLNGITIGHLRGLAPGTDVVVSITEVVEATADLAIADRVAYVVTARTGHDHVVLAGEDCYLVASVSPSLDWAAAMRLVAAPEMPRIVSVASAEGILPILLSA